MNTTTEPGVLSIEAWWKPTPKQIAFDFYYNDRLYRFAFDPHEPRILSESEGRRFDDYDLETWERQPESNPPEPVIYYISLNQNKWTEMNPDDGEPLETTDISIVMDRSYRNGITYGRHSVALELLKFIEGKEFITVTELLIWTANIK